MGLYKRILEEVSQEETPGHSEAASSYRRVWRHPAPEVGGYLTVEDLELEQEWLQRERRRVQEEKDKTSGEIRALRALARQGVQSPRQGVAFRSLQRKYPAEWDRIRWSRRTCS